MTLMKTLRTLMTFLKLLMMDKVVKLRLEVPMGWQPWEVLEVQPVGVVARVCWVCLACLILW